MVECSSGEVRRCKGGAKEGRSGRCARPSVNRPELREAAGTGRSGGSGASGRHGCALLTVTATAPKRRLSSKKETLQAALLSGSATLYDHRSSKRHRARVLHSRGTVPIPDGGEPWVRPQ